MNAVHVNKLGETGRDLIISLVPEGSRVLDLGCGDCSLLGELVLRKQVTGVGVDIDGDLLVNGLAIGVPVYQGDLDEGLADFPDDSFDFVILNQTLQVIKRPLMVLKEMLRIGQYGIVGFPNFGHWRMRTGLFFKGRAPTSPALPFEWYDTPNIRQLTIQDFREYCSRERIRIATSHYLMGASWHDSVLFDPLANLFAHVGVFVIRRGD